MFIRNLVLALALFIFIVTCGCIAPMSRTSVIKTNAHYEIGGGAILSKSVVQVDDTTSAWGGRLENATYLGLQGNLRLGYGFGSHYGIDFTLSILSGIPLFKEHSFKKFAMWPHSSFCLKLRPWKSNNLLLCGIATPGILTVSWVYGWPSQEREKYSSAIEVGNMLPAAVFNGWTGQDFKEGLLPSMISFCVSRNIYYGSQRLSPNLALSLVWDWDEDAIELGSIMFGLNWAP